MNLKLTTNEKRFLVIWIIVHSFALFVNLADIEGAIDFNNRDYTYTPTYFFTHYNSNRSDFWPFTKFITTSRCADCVSSETIFEGVFNSYGTAEYLFYMVIGLAIIFVPKLWRK